MVSAERCRELNGLLEGRLLSGMYCATDAQVDPFEVTHAFARAAAKPRRTHFRRNTGAGHRA